MSTAGMAFVKEHAAGEISPGRLRRYLCDEACSPGQKEVRAEACRSCESACAYGRRFLRLLDAGEITTQAAERTASSMAGRPECGTREPPQGRQTSGNSERMPGMGPGMEASGNCAAYLHSAGRPECGTCEQLKAPTDLEIMEALKAENEEMFAKLMAAEGENADMRMEKAADELTILKLKARLYDVLLGDQEENRQ